MKFLFTILPLILSITSSCIKRNRFDDARRINIQVTDIISNLPVDSVEFYIVSYPLNDFKIVCRSVTDNNGKCGLFFYYDYYDNEFKVSRVPNFYTSTDPIITYSGEYSNFEIYKINGDFPILDLKDNQIFNLNIELIPVSEIKIDCLKYGIMSSDSIILTFWENDILMKERKFKVEDYKPNFYYYYPKANVNTQINYKVIRNKSEIINGTKLFKLDKFKSDTLVLKIDTTQAKVLQ